MSRPGALTAATSKIAGAIPIANMSILMHTCARVIVLSIA